MSKCLMFVDDDDSFLEILRRACRGLPAVTKVWEAADGAIGLAILNRLVTSRDRIPDMVFVDINMPVMDGFAFLRRLAELQKQHPALATMKPVAMLTSSDQARDRDEAKSLGADEYIVKPVGLAATRDAIARFL